MSDTLAGLATILKASPGGGSLSLLGRLLDSLPIGVLITDSSPALRCAYANEVLRAWVPADKVPIEGRPLGEVWERAEENGVLAILRQAAAAVQPQHLRGFDYVGLIGLAPTMPGGVSVWDWEVYPLADETVRVTHLLVIILDATGRAIVGPQLSDSERRRLAEVRESASGIIRIFGAAPDQAAAVDDLTPRELEVAELIAEGLSNAEIAARIFRSHATVASHVSQILRKLGFNSRAQVAVWAVRRRLQAERD